MMSLITSIVRGLVIYHQARARWRVRHPGIPYRRRWSHLRTSCAHDDPEGRAWVRRCDRAEVSPGVHDR